MTGDHDCLSMSQFAQPSHVFSYYASRADAMHTIESTIVELGGIFTQLAHMVKEQEEMVQRIDSNVEDTALNVEMGHNEILKYVACLSDNNDSNFKTLNFQVFPICHFQPMAHGKDLRCPDFLFPDICHFHGIKMTQ